MFYCSVLYNDRRHQAATLEIQSYIIFAHQPSPVFTSIIELTHAQHCIIIHRIHLCWYAAFVHYTNISIILRTSTWFTEPPSLYVTPLSRMSISIQCLFVHHQTWCHESTWCPCSWLIWTFDPMTFCRPCLITGPLQIGVSRGASVIRYVRISSTDESVVCVPTDMGETCIDSVLTLYNSQH